MFIAFLFIAALTPPPNPEVDTKVPAAATPGVRHSHFLL